MSGFDRNMRISVVCPKCEEQFKETIARLKEMIPTLICPACGPFHVDAEEYLGTLENVEGMLSDMERLSRN
jgi:hypothetical protein